MKRSAIALLGLLIAATAFAQSDRKNTDYQSPTEQPYIEQILDKYAQAAGGKAAIEKITTRVMKGSFSVPSKDYKRAVEIHAKAPNKYVLLVTGLANDAGQGFDGAIGWDLDFSVTGLRELTGTQLVWLKHDAEFYKELKLKDLYPRMTLKGREKIGDREAYVIEAAAEGLNLRRFYFDVATSLLIRRDTSSGNAQDKPLVETYYEDYRQVDGVNLPFKIRNVFPGANIMNVFEFSEVKQNVAIDDAGFKKPVS